jgi:ankyrin repeat protein
MLTILEQINQQLTENPNDTGAIISLIKKAKQKDKTLSRSLEIDGISYTIPGLILEKCSNEVAKELFKKILSDGRVNLKTHALFDPTGHRYSPLGLAIKNDKIGVITTLLDVNKELINTPSLFQVDNSNYSPIGFAIKENKIDILKTLLKFRFNRLESNTRLFASSHNNQGIVSTYDALSVAVYFNNLDLIKILINEDPYIINRSSFSPSIGVNCPIIDLVAKSTKYEDVPKIRILLEKGADFEKYDGKVPPTCSEIFQNEINRVKKNKEFFKKIHEKLQEEPQNKEDILKLIKQAKEIDRSLSTTSVIDNSSYTILGLILEKCQDDIANDLVKELLLDSDIDFKDSVFIDLNGNGFNAIGLAIAKGQTEVVKTLLKHDKDIIKHSAFRKSDGMEYSPLGFAVEKGHAEIVETLLISNPDSLTDVASYKDHQLSINAFGLAVCCYNTKLIKTFIEHNPQILNCPASRKADHEFTALDLCVSKLRNHLVMSEAYKKLEDIIKILLEKGADYKEYDGLSKDICPEFLQKEIDRVKKSKEVFKKIHEKLQEEPQNKDGILELIKQAKQDNANLSTTSTIDGSSYTILGLILGKCQDDIANDLVKELLDSDIDLKADVFINKKGHHYSALGLAILHDKKEIIENLLEYNKDLANSVVATDIKGVTFTAMGAAVSKGDVVLIKTLLKSGGNLMHAQVINDPNGTTLTALGLAVDEDKLEVLKTLIKLDPKIVNSQAIKRPDGTTLTALDFAVQNNKNDLIKFLLDNGADYEKYDKKSPDICPEFLQKEIDRVKKSKEVFKKIHEKLQEEPQNKDGILELIKQAKQDNANLSTTSTIDGSTYTILGLILKKCQDVIANELVKELLLDTDIDLKTDVLINKDGARYSALGLAVQNGRIEVVKTLLEKQPDQISDNVFKNNKATLTALGLAAFNGNMNLVNELLKHHKDLKNDHAGTDTSGWVYTTLGVAIRGKKNAVIKNLLTYNRDLVNSTVVTNIDGTTLTALDYAVKANKNDVIKILLENGADYEKYDKKSPDICPEFLQKEINELKDKLNSVSVSKKRPREDPETSTQEVGGSPKPRISSHVRSSIDSSKSAQSGNGRDGA